MCASRLPRYGSLSHLFIHKCSLCPTEQRLVKREKGYQSKSFFSSSLSLSLSQSLSTLLQEIMESTAVSFCDVHTSPSRRALSILYFNSAPKAEKFCHHLYLHTLGGTGVYISCGQQRMLANIK